MECTTKFNDFITNMFKNFNDVEFDINTIKTQITDFMINEKKYPA